MLKSVQLLFISLVIIISGCQTTGTPDKASVAKKSNECRAKNVIIMIPDGCSMSIQTLARLYKGSDLYLDELNSGSVRTYAASSMITDSAAAVTAFATGHKGTLGALAVGPKKEGLMDGINPTVQPYYPVATVLEGARSKGMATGVIATNEICDATPAGFTSHVSSRREMDGIIKQMVYQDIDVVFGGGGQYLFPEGTPTPYMDLNGGIIFGARHDSENLMDALTKRGYKFIQSGEELSGIHDGPVWGIFSEGKLCIEMNRETDQPLQPSLAEMTEKAIEILSRDEDGFLLVVEGSQVDWGGHSHDAKYMLTEFLAFDDAVGKALEFAKKDGNTLLIAFPDHNTGGLVLGNNNKKYNSYTITAEDIAGILKKANVNFYKLIELLNKEKDITEKDIIQIFADRLGLSIDDSQAKEILAMRKDFYGIVDYINNNIYAIGWTTNMHAADDVPLWAYSKDCECTPRGNMENTEIAMIISRTLGFDLKNLTEDLYVEAGSVFKDYEFIDNPGEPTLKIGDALLHAGKDILTRGDKSYRMNGVVIYAPEINKFFISREAIDLISAK